MFCISFETFPLQKREKNPAVYYSKTWGRYMRKNMKKLNIQTTRKKKEEVTFFCFEIFSTNRNQSLAKDCNISTFGKTEEYTWDTIKQEEKKLGKSVFPNRTHVLSLVIGHRWGADASKHNSSISKTWQKGQWKSQITKPQVRKKKNQPTSLLTYQMH